MSKIAAIQMCSETTIGSNLIIAEAQIKKAVAEGAELVVLPESFAFLGGGKDVQCIAEPFANGRIQDWASKIADEQNIWLVAGTIPIESEQTERVRAASIVYDNDGQEVARYDKMHLFNHTLPDGSGAFNEAAYFEAGDELVVVETPHGNIGLSVCYDLRFPEMFRQLREKGAEIITVPSAFFQATGRVHWRPLLTARAIENQCFIVAPNQCGLHCEIIETYGDTVILGPWGLELDSKKMGNGYAIADCDLVRLQVLREDFPVWDHRKL